MNDDRNAPATKGDHVEWGTRTVEALTKVIRDSQAEILNAFSVCVEAVHAQIKARDDAYAGFAESLTALEERLLEVEKRLLMPPAA
jgi:hypothetical protein